MKRTEPSDEADPRADDQLESADGRDTAYAALAINNADLKRDLDKKAPMLATDSDALRPNGPAIYTQAQHDAEMCTAVQAATAEVTEDRAGVAARSTAVIEAAAPASRGYDLWTLKDIVGRVEFLVDQFIVRTGFGMIFGQPTSGKSTAMVSLSMHLMAGATHWHGRRMPQEGPGRVVYISGEGTPGLVARFEAAAGVLGLTRDEVADRLFITRDSGRISEAADVDQWLKDIERNFASRPGPPLRMIVLDTLARNFGPGNEDKVEDSGRFIDGVDRLAKAFDCLVMVTHHTGHAAKDRFRGSTNFGGALDVSLPAELPNGIGTPQVTLSVSKPKDFEGPPPIHAKIVTKSVGVTGDGTGAYFESREGPPDKLRTAADADEDDAVETLLEFLEGHPTASQTAVAEGLRWTRTAVRKRIDRAVAGGRLSVSGSWQKKTYSVRTLGE